MRVLRIRQPCAELILQGIKTVESGSLPTRIIGERLYIPREVRQRTVRFGARAARIGERGHRHCPSWTLQGRTLMLRWGKGLEWSWPEGRFLCIGRGYRRVVNEDEDTCG